MARADFQRHLAAAAHRALVLTRTRCVNRLSDYLDFLIQPDNLSELAPYPSALELARFLDRKREIGQRFTLAEVVQRLWVAEQVPVYINISVCQASRHRTALELFIDRRLRRDTVNLFHEQEGYPPLHVLVAVPPFAVNGQRFNVNWKHWPWRIKLLACRSWRRLHRLRAR